MANTWFRKKDWTEVPVGDLLLRLYARISARFIVGLPLCRNEEWLRVSTVVGENVFTTVIVLRMLPPVLRPLLPLVLRCLPTWYRLRENLSTATKLIAPVLEHHEEKKSGETVDSGEDASSLLLWMRDNALNELEKDPMNLAYRQIFLGLGSIHTTASATSHAIHDLCSHPELLEPLREEVEQILIADGGWEKATLMKMWKLDSFMSESQRLSPPFLSKSNLSSS